MPQRFVKRSPNVRGILDCTEVALEGASSLTLQSETFSAYKNRTTLKGLIGVAPNGLVTFISQLYTGCISDKEITKISGILPLLEPGDEVMADKGFLIQDLLDEVGAKLTMPPFRHPGQFSKRETEETQAIARLRIIVEQAIARIEHYHIWDSPVPLTLIGTVNQIWHNCCFG
uniref:DDE Tnp4 domain-containing protein n=1 Tax=Knipowitschia caucasica TaxID=637954 RepID=A0AAV2JF01_KNICA